MSNGKTNSPERLAVIAPLTNVKSLDFTAPLKMQLFKGYPELHL